MPVWLIVLLAVMGGGIIGILGMSLLTAGKMMDLETEIMRLRELVAKGGGG